MTGENRALPTVACAQVALRLGDLEGNARTVEDAVRRAARSGASVVVLPELASSGYSFTDIRQAREYAEPVPGPTTERWATLAEELGVVIVGGLCEDGGDVLFNTAVVVDPDGLRAAYRKVHLWDRERLIFRPGDRRPPVVEVFDGWRLAVMVCYDLEFPEWVRLPALAGADLLAVPVNWPSFPRPAGERPMDIVRAQAAAAQNRLFVAVCDRTGAEAGTDWVGGSVILDPDGWPLAGGSAYDGEQVLTAPCDLGRSRDKRLSALSDVHADRRPDLYHDTTEDRP